MNKYYLFVCGCPRSGTTAMWRILTYCNEIAIGNERYILKAFNSFSLEPKLFTFDKFYSQEKHETHWPNILEGRVGEYYKKLESQYPNCSFYGDKIPTLYKFLPELDTAFPDHKTIYMVRNILDVAHSYKKRLLNPEDSWKKGVSEAIKDWNKSIKVAIDLIGNSQYLVVLYDEFFSGNNKDLIDELVTFIGPKNDEALRQGYEKELKASEYFLSNRQYSLNNSEVKEILLHARNDLFQELYSKRS